MTLFFQKSDKRVLMKLTFPKKMNVVSNARNYTELDLERIEAVGITGFHK